MTLYCNDGQLRTVSAFRIPGLNSGAILFLVHRTRGAYCILELHNCYYGG